jgi:hypothetical protein
MFVVNLAGWLGVALMRVFSITGTTPAPLPNRRVGATNPGDDESLLLTVNVFDAPGLSFADDGDTDPVCVSFCAVTAKFTLPV